MTDNSSVDGATGLLHRQAFLKEVREAQDSLPQRVRRGCLLLLHFPIVESMYAAGAEHAADDALRHLLAIVETRLRSRDTLGRIGKHSLCIFLRQCKEADALIVADQHTVLLRDVVINANGKTVALDFRYRLVPLDARGERLKQGVSKLIVAPDITDKSSLLKTFSVVGNEVDLSASSVVSLNDVRKDVKPAENLAPAANLPASLLPVGISRASQSYRLRPGLLIQRKSLICCLRLQSIGINDKSEQLQDSVVMASVIAALSLSSTNKRPVVESQLILPISALQLNVQFPEWIKQRCKLMRVAPSDICLSISVGSLSDELRAMAPILRELNRSGIRLMIEDVSSAAQFRMMQNLANFDYLYISGKHLQASLKQAGEREELVALIAEAQRQNGEICCGGIDSQSLLKLAQTLKVEIGFGRECGQSMPFPREAWKAG